MLVSDIIALARRWTFTDSTQYSDANALSDFNIVNRDMVARIEQDVNNDQMSDFFQSSLVAGQAEYSKPIPTSQVPGFQNLLNVSVNYTAPTLGTGTVATTSGSKTITGTGTTFTQSFTVGNNINIGSFTAKVITITSDTSLTIDTPATTTASGQAYYVHIQDWQLLRSERTSNLERDQDWYRTNQPKDDPFFIMYDTGILIYPVPLVDVPFGYKVYATKKTVDLGLTDTPIYDDNWHYVAAIGMKRFIFYMRGLYNEANLANQEYEAELQKIINTISDIQLTPFFRDNPPLTEFQ